MTIKETIETLLKTYDENEEIIVAWWDKDMAPCDIKNIPWENQVDIIENKMDWSGTREDMGTCIEIYNEED